MSKHTPGPWRAKPAMPAVSDTIVCSKGNVVADVVMRDSTDELRANARLIAAAPELLQALVRYVAADYEKHGNTESVVWHNRRLASARAAIAKATGEA